jgi:hypothetical protein
MTDFMVLTIDAAQIAVRKKHRPCAPLTDQAGFLPLMQRHQRNAHQILRTAKARLLRAVNAAAPRTKVTIRNIQHHSHQIHRNSLLIITQNRKYPPRELAKQQLFFL